MADQPSPLLPPEPWYTSSVQRAQVFAALSSVAAILIPLFGLNIDMQIINAKIALVAQLVNLGFTIWGIIKRQSSTIQPLTLTKSGAEKKADISQLDPATMALKVSGAAGLAAGQQAGGQPDTANQAPTV